MADGSYRAASLDGPGIERECDRQTFAMMNLALLEDVFEENLRASVRTNQFISSNVWIIDLHGDEIGAYSSRAMWYAKFMVQDTLVKVQSRLISCWMLCYLDCPYLFSASSHSHHHSALYLLL